MQRAVDVAESARSEAADLKRKLTVAQEMADKFTAEAREVSQQQCILASLFELLLTEQLEHARVDSTTSVPCGRK